MARFGVSRTVLREALKTLAAKGLIVPRARIGTRVTSRETWSLFDPDILNWHFETGIDEAFLVHLSKSGSPSSLMRRGWPPSTRR